jgi:hypothetical protein
VRPNSTDYTYRVYDVAGALLGSSSFVGGPAHPEALFISLDGHNGMTATWDDVTVSGNIVPEPAVLWALAGVLPLLRRRRQNGTFLINGRCHIRTVPFSASSG